MTGGSLQIRGARPKHYNRHMFSYRVLTLTPVGVGRFQVWWIKFYQFCRVLSFYEKTDGQYQVLMRLKWRQRVSVPQCENIIAEFEAIARDINNFNLEQCGLAKQLAGGLVGQLEAGQGQSCLMHNAVKKTVRIYQGT